MAKDSVLDSEIINLEAYKVFLLDRSPKTHPPDPYIVRGRLYFSWRKKVCFDFAAVMCSIGAPDIPKNFAKGSEVKNTVFLPPHFYRGKIDRFRLKWH